MKGGQGRGLLPSSPLKSWFAPLGICINKHFEMTSLKKMKELKNDYP